MKNLMILLFRFYLYKLMTITNIKRLIKNRGKILILAFWFIWILVSTLEFVELFYPVKNRIKSRYIWPTLWLCLIFCIRKNRPKSHFEKKLRNKDVFVWVKIWDITEAKTIVVPINNKFEINQHMIKSNNSVLNSVIKEIYDWNSDHLISDIKNQLDDKKTYQMWDFITVTHKDKKIYLVVNSRLNENKRAESTKDEFYDTIIQFFYKLSNDSDMEEIAMPLLNSEHGKISDLNRDKILKEIIYLFIEQTKSEICTPKLTIYILPSAISKKLINIDEIGAYLEYNADNYRDIIVNNVPTEWTPIEENLKPSTIATIDN